MTTIDLDRLHQAAMCDQYEPDRWSVYADALEDAGRLEDAAVARARAAAVAKDNALTARVEAALDGADVDPDLYCVCYLPRHLRDRDDRFDGWEPRILPGADDDTPEDEWEDTYEAVAQGCTADTPTQWVVRLLEDLPADAVLFEHCPRGFSNEISYYWTVGPLPDRRGVEELTVEEFARDIVSGLEFAANDRRNDVNTYTNPTSGDWRLTEWRDEE